MTILYTKDREPDYVGTYGQAWRIDMPGLRERLGTTSDQDSAVAGWIVDAPYAHPLWHSYMISAVHLRDIPGAGPAKINMENATHEIMVYALDPAQPTTLNDRPAILLSANFHGQFIEPSDEAAVLRVQETVKDVCNATLSPDTDNRRQWIKRFSASNVL